MPAAQFRRISTLLPNLKSAFLWARLIIGSLVLLSAVIGIYLTFKTGWPLLLIGLLSFLIGYALLWWPSPDS